MPGSHSPAPWRIIEGPLRSPQSSVDGEVWGFVLERDGEQRSLIVAVSRRALEVESPERLPTRTREAIATDGRSEAETAARISDPPGCLMLGRSGYLPAPPALVRLAS